MSELSIASTTTLHDGNEMPVFGLGTYKDSTEEAAHAVEYALSLGYRLVDTASLYGNEEGVGEGLRRSGVPRDDVWITTKIWNDEQGYDETIAALDRSLDRLGTDYVDLYLIHWPNRRLLEPTWRALEDLRRAGKTRSIGVSNFLVPHLTELFRIADVPPAVDQFEMHVRLQQPDVVRMLAERDVFAQAWAPLLKGKIGLVPEVANIAAAHDKTPAQVAIRWLLQRGVGTIPKSTHDARIAENADVFDFELTLQEMDILATLDAGQRLGPDPDTNVWND